MSPTYLDHAATTPMSGAALSAMTHELAQTGNPSSLHGAGRRAHRVMEEAREELAAAAGAHPSEVIFTSGGTESDNLALKGLFWSRTAIEPTRTRIIVPTIEHHAVLDTVEWLAAHQGATISWLEVDTDGVINLSALQALIRQNPADIALITCMWANNEVGSIQPIHQVVALAEPHGIPVHSDAVQAFTSVPTHFADSRLATMAISGHKIGGPVGIGALLVRRNVTLTPVQHGGGHERALRSGTLNSASAAGFAAAASTAAATLSTENERLATLRDSLITSIGTLIPAAVLNGSADPQHTGTRLPGNVHFTFPGCEGDSLLFVLDMLGIHSSTGSACTAGVPRPSHVLLAMGRDERTARGAQRFSLGHTTGTSDVEKLVAALPEAYERAKKAGMAAQISSIQTAGTGFTR